MSEVGLVPFARQALAIASAVWPPYRTRFRKHTFTQPQLLALLCRMRYEDWTFREVEVRLNEHVELRRVLGLPSVPDYTTLYRFMRRLPETVLAQALNEVVRRFPAPGRAARVAIDGTGLTHRAVSAYSHKRTQLRGFPRCYWLQWVLVVDLDRKLLLAQAAHAGPSNDCGRLPPLLAAAGETTPIGLVLADAEFDSERNHRFIRKKLRARRVIPAKKGHRRWRIHGVRAQMRGRFPRKVYARRALIEAVISCAKRKLSARAAGRTGQTQSLQAVVLGVAFNIYRLQRRHRTKRNSTKPLNSLNEFCFRAPKSTLQIPPDPE
jgi:hypothetical protein